MRLLTLAILLTFICTSWVHSQVPPQAAEQVSASVRHFPLDAGWKWEYSGSFKAPLSSKPTTAEMVITAPKTVLGKNYSTVVTTIKDTPVGEFTEELYYRHHEKGVMRVGLKSKDESLFLPVDVKPGDKWESALTDKVLLYEAVGVEDVKGADGKLYKDCLKVTSKSKVGKGVDDAIWLAPDVGVVRRLVRRPLYTVDVVLVRATRPAP